MVGWNEQIFIYCFSCFFAYWLTALNITSVTVITTPISAAGAFATAARSTTTMTASPL